MRPSARSQVRKAPDSLEGGDQIFANNSFNMAAMSVNSSFGQKRINRSMVEVREPTNNTQRPDKHDTLSQGNRGRSSSKKKVKIEDNTTPDMRSSKKSRKSESKEERYARK